MKQEVERKSWERDEIFSFFSRVSNPFYMLAFRQDVTKLVQSSRERNRSFYYSMIYLSTKALNSIDAFKYVIEGEKVYLLDERIPSFTDMKKGSELFHIVTLPAHGSLDDFVEAAREKSKEQRGFIEYGLEQENLIYYSCTPWMEITAVTNEHDLMRPGAADETIPRITWGKYHSEGSRIMIEVSMEVNHRVIDGFHIGQFHKKLGELIDILG